MSAYLRVKSDYTGTHIFEEKTTFAFSNKKNLQSQSRKRFKSLIPSFTPIYGETIDYTLPLLDKKTTDLLLPEALNIYLIMFYLGSIVRYQPYAFKKILPQKEGWVVQSFTHTCPKKFLRLITAQIFGKILLFQEI